MASEFINHNLITSCSHSRIVGWEKKTKQDNDTNLLFGVIGDVFSKFQAIYNMIQLVKIRNQNLLFPNKLGGPFSIRAPSGMGATGGNGPWIWWKSFWS